MTRLTTPRIVVAGLSGDSGKTLVTLGLIRAMVRRGLVVQPFKKGPDYIDPAWLAAAARRPCRSLDTFLMERPGIDRALTHADDADVAVIEGNRGLFDGVDAAGSHSTAELAKRVGASVVLVVNATKSTRTVAAPIAGCRTLDPMLDLAGVIVNRVGTSRQEVVIRDAVESATGVPVVGVIARLGGDDPLPGRHLGLVTVAEHPLHHAAVDRAADAVERGVDLDRVLGFARRAAPLELAPVPDPSPGPPVRIGYLVDEAFSFYYPANLEHLVAAGADLIRVDAASEHGVPELDGLYIGGGFPEVHAARLSANRTLLRTVRERAAAGLPIYAECGGLMFLARELRVDGVAHTMAGVLDLVVEQTPRPCGHGYVEAVVDRVNAVMPVGTTLRGHEFHYSRIVGGDDLDRSVLRLERGVGARGGRDGIVRGSVWASYLHVHTLGSPTWADGFLAQARQLAATGGRAASWV